MAEKLESCEWVACGGKHDIVLLLSPSHGKCNSFALFLTRMNVLLAIAASDWDGKKRATLIDLSSRVCYDAIFR